MMRRCRNISIVASLVVVTALAGCDDSAVSQPNATDSTEVASSSPAGQPAAEKVEPIESEQGSPAAESKPTKPAEAQNNEPATTETPSRSGAGNLSNGEEEPDASPEQEKPTENASPPPMNRTFRRPPLPNETAPPPQPRVVRPTTTGTASSGGVTEITFDTIKFDIEPGDPFTREMLTDEIENLFGKTVRIRGYIYPPFQQSGIKQFVLVRDNMECCFGPGAALYDCVAVDMVDDKTIDYTVRPVAVEGTFRLNEVLGLGGEHLSIFHLDGVKVR